MKLKNHIIACAIPLISIVFDLVVMHAAGQDFQLVQYSRAIVMFLIIVLYLYRGININIATVSILIFLFYLLAIILIREVPSGEFIRGFRWFSRVSISMLLLLVGFRYINTEEKIHHLNIFTILTGASIIIYLFIVNVFDIGVSMYFRDEDMISVAGVIRTGLIGGVGMNTISYILLVAPIIIFISYDRIKLSSIVTLIFVLLLLSLFLVLRRSALIIVLFGYFIYIMRAGVLGLQFKRSIILGALILIISFPIYDSYLTSIYEIRGERAISTEAFDTDTRSRELGYVLHNITNSDDLEYQLFGKSFNTIGAFPFASVERSLHSDISNLLYITGFTGLILYLFIHLAVLLVGYRYRKYAPKIYFITVIVLIVSSILLMYPGRLTAITYKSIMYIYLGSLLGTMYNNYKQQIYS